MEGGIAMELVMSELSELTERSKQFPSPSAHY